MKQNPSVIVLFGLLVAVIAFHLLIIAKIIPYSIAWGGRLQNDSEMYVFEAISVLINLFLGLVLLMKVGYTKPYFNEKTINILLWIFLILFILNTVGNFLAKTIFEKLFAVLTFTFSILIWRILRTKHINDTKS